MAQKMFVLATSILICALIGMFFAPAMASVNVIQLTSGSAIDLFSVWSPEGTKITFVSNRAGNSDIWVMDSDGSNQVQLTNIGKTGKPKWNPAGTKIAFSSDRAGNWDVWAMDNDGNS